MAELTERERRIAAQLAEFWRDEHDEVAPKATITIGPFSAYVVIGGLQLACRHPAMSKINRQAIESVARQLQVLFAGELAESLEQGWDPSLDREDI